MFKYFELSDDAKLQAIKDYKIGWSLTHPEDIPSDQEIDAILMNSEGNHDLDGYYLED